MNKFTDLQHNYDLRCKCNNCINYEIQLRKSLKLENDIQRKLKILLDAEQNRTNNFEFGSRSKGLLLQVHYNLQQLAQLMLYKSKYDLTILPSTIRTIEEQIQFVKKGTSKTYFSRHLSKAAIDVGVIVNGKLTWNSKYYYEVLPSWRECVKELGLQDIIRFGADFKSFQDLVHIELRKDFLPDDPNVLAELRNRKLIK